MTQEDVASSIQGVVKWSTTAFREMVVEIDQDIAAKDEIKVAHGAHGHPVAQIEVADMNHGGCSLPDHPLVAGRQPDTCRGTLRAHPATDRAP